MRPAVAFAVGLWTGGLVVGGVWLVHRQQPPATPAAPVVVAEPVAPTDESVPMRQENARLQAETGRLRETVETLQQTGSVNRRLAGEATAEAGRVEAKVEAFSLPRLEARASQNNVPALRRLLANVEEGQAVLLRLWKNPQLSDANRAIVERQLSLQLERLTTELAPAVPLEDSTGPATPSIPATPVTPVTPP